MQDPMISIIVPVYKVEPYLNRCVESIVNQTYKNLEIILVDDGSPDNCPAMCDAWAMKDARIKVIHKINGGLSDARNAGLSEANGDLIGFVDSDDWIGPEMYQHLYNDMVQTDSDIAACGVQLVWENDTPTKMLTTSNNCVLNIDEAMRAIIKETKLKQPVWYKLYHRDTIRGILFPVGKCHEDVFWSYQAIGNAKRISINNSPDYFYWQRNGSIMGEHFSLRRLDALKAKMGRQKYIESRFPKLSNVARTDLYLSCVYLQQMALKYLTHSECIQATEMIKAVLSQDSMDTIEITGLTHKLWYLLSKIDFIGTCKLRNTLKIGF